MRVLKIKVRGQEEEVTEYKFKDPRELALKAMQEIRGQLKLQLEIFQALFDMQAVQQFQAEVLEVIGKCFNRSKRSRSFAGSRKEMLFGQLLTSIEQKFRRDDGKACGSLGAFGRSARRESRLASVRSDKAPMPDGA